ncbi:MAG TPA: SDR family oxidoreductase [Bryobacteraceae bacterium]|jgi:NAD(P)-dependent dehydrogenase (short-subunit alcohol dehydrogenase family)|nr:SDR family oxidoreductase [Bryobacteraceae bacterium]
METLEGKVAIVTGGTRGIGRAIAERLLAENCRVAICGRSEATVNRAVAEMNRPGAIFGVAADITQPAQVEHLFSAVDQQFGGLDILVNNAGEGVFRKVGEMTVDDWRRNIDLNLNGAFYCAHAALARFGPRGGGFIVNISSLAARNPFSGGAGYNASKFGLNGFSEALMLDHRYDNVRVCSVMPGSVDTEFSGHSATKGAADSSWKVAPQDVAEVVATVLRMPARTMVSEVQMRPSKPKK